MATVDPVAIFTINIYTNDGTLIKSYSDSSSTTLIFDLSQMHSDLSDMGYVNVVGISKNEGSLVAVTTSRILLLLKLLQKIVIFILSNLTPGLMSWIVAYLPIKLHQVSHLCSWGKWPPAYQSSDYWKIMFIFQTQTRSPLMVKMGIYGL